MLFELKLKNGKESAKNRGVVIEKILKKVWRIEGDKNEKVISSSDSVNSFF